MAKKTEKTQAQPEEKTEEPLKVGDTLLLNDDPQVPPPYKNRPGFVKKPPTRDDPRVTLSITAEGATKDLVIHTKHTRRP